MNDFKFSIITPSIGRSTLLLTVESVQKQNYSNYEHLIVFDGAECYEKGKELLLSHNVDLKNIIFASTEFQTKNFGNSQRRLGNQISTGDYTTYLDDDDIHINNTLVKVNDALQRTFIKHEQPGLSGHDILDDKPNFIVFPCLRFGEVFYNKPPGLQRTVSCQYFHKRVINGELIQWFEELPEDHQDAYTLDGLFVNYLRDQFGVSYLDGEPLSEVDHKSIGKML